MKETNSGGIKQLVGTDLHPGHESWVPIANHTSFVGLMIFLVLAALFITTMAFHPSPGDLRSLLLFFGIAVVLIVLGLVWRNTPKRHRGFLGNAGLTAHIKADLMMELGTNHVNVDSSNGVTTLRGTVPYPDFREAAEQLAREGGAQTVIDELTVAPSAQAQPDPYFQGIPGITTSEGAPVVEKRVTLAQRVREALEDDPRINASVMTVSVDDRVAYLTGRQGTTDVSEAATEVAAHVPGIVAVSNDIEIIANA